MFQKCFFSSQNMRKAPNVLFLRSFIHISYLPKHKLLVPVFIGRQNNLFFSQAVENAEVMHNYSNKIQSFGPVTKKFTKHFLFREYMLKNSHNYPTLYIPGVTSVNSSSQTLNFLKEFKSNEQNDSDALLELKSIMTSELDALDKEDIREILHAFALTTFKCDKFHIMEALSVLNDECLKRFKTWTIDDHLMQIDSFHASSCFINIKYTWKAIGKNCFKLYSLTPKQVVHTLYLLSFFTKFFHNELKFKFQDNLCKFVPHLNLTELALMNYTLSCINLRVSHPTLLSSTINKLLDNKLENVEKWAIHSFFEAPKKIGTFTSLSDVIELQGRLIPLLNELDVNTAATAVSCGIKANMVNADLLKRVLEKAKGDIDVCSFSSLVSLICLCVKFNVYDDDFIKMATDQIKRRDYFEPTKLVAFVKHLVHMNVLDEDLIKRVLSKENVELLLKHTHRISKVDLLFLDNTVRLEMPQYDGPMLEEPAKTKLWRVYKGFGFHVKQINSLLNQDRIYGKLQSKIGMEYMEKKVTWKKILSGYPAMLVIRLDENLNLTSIPEEFIRFKGPRDVLKPLNDGFTWVVIVTVTDFLLGLDGKMDGFVSTRIRHVEKVGYNILKLNLNDLNKSYFKNEFKEYFESQVRQQLGKRCATS